MWSQIYRMLEVTGLSNSLYFNGWENPDPGLHISSQAFFSQIIAINTTPVAASVFRLTTES